ncbi:MAG: outer membrane lipoprotein-sorting protein [Bacteroidales bacterium]|nr:outer membrane lipoprotein-sorting protein [Bacteroidales bacterium]
MKSKKIFATILLVALFTGNLFAQSANEINKKSMDAIEVGNMEMISTINIRDARGNNRVRKITTASKQFGNVTKMIIRFISPADVKGTALLVHDYEKKSDDMWIYMPALRKVRRIVSSEKSKNFMGSEFTNGDMSKPNLDNYNSTILGSVNYGGRNCWKIQSVGKTSAIQAEDGFSKRISYIEKSTYLCHKVEYYDLRGRLHRTQTISDYRRLKNGKYFAYKMVMENNKNGRKSEMIINNFQLGSNLSESAFAPAALNK